MTLAKNDVYLLQERLNRIKELYNVYESVAGVRELAIDIFDDDTVDEANAKMLLLDISITECENDILRLFIKNKGVES